MGALLPILLPLLIQYGPAAAEEIWNLGVQIKAMYIDGKVPTAADWAALDQALDAAHARLQATAPQAGKV